MRKKRSNPSPRRCADPRTPSLPLSDADWCGTVGIASLRPAPCVRGAARWGGGWLGVLGEPLHRPTPTSGALLLGLRSHSNANSIIYARQNSP